LPLDAAVLPWRVNARKQIDLPGQEALRPGQAACAQSEPRSRRRNSGHFCGTTPVPQAVLQIQKNRPQSYLGPA